ncbi:hypothetical protein [Pseudoclavibacter helvolus]|uniref:hypothetical protein n=1 Tax=Pseudoclavibacter helvolus TaxID=255205 RepID=UPI003C77B356
MTKTTKAAPADNPPAVLATPHARLGSLLDSALRYGDWRKEGKKLDLLAHVEPLVVPLAAWAPASDAWTPWVTAEWALTDADSADVDGDRISTRAGRVGTASFDADCFPALASIQLGSEKLLRPGVRAAMRGRAVSMVDAIARATNLDHTTVRQAMRSLKPSEEGTDSAWSDLIRAMEGDADDLRSRFAAEAESSIAWADACIRDGRDEVVAAQLGNTRYIASFGRNIGIYEEVDSVDGRSGERRPPIRTRITSYLAYESTIRESKALTREGLLVAADDASPRQAMVRILTADGVADLPDPMPMHVGLDPKTIRDPAQFVTGGKHVAHLVDAGKYRQPVHAAFAALSAGRAREIEIPRNGVLQTDHGLRFVSTHGTLTRDGFSSSARSTANAKQATALVPEDYAGVGEVPSGPDPLQADQELSTSFVRLIREGFPGLPVLGATLLAVMAAAPFVGDIAHPMVALSGTFGHGKSTTAKATLTALTGAAGSNCAISLNDPAHGGARGTLHQIGSSVGVLDDQKNDETGRASGRKAAAAAAELIEFLAGNSYDLDDRMTAKRDGSLSAPKPIMASLVVTGETEIADPAKLSRQIVIGIDPTRPGHTHAANLPALKSISKDTQLPHRYWAWVERALRQFATMSQLSAHVQAYRDEYAQSPGVPSDRLHEVPGTVYSAFRMLGMPNLFAEEGGPLGMSRDDWATLWEETERTLLAEAIRVQSGVAREERMLSAFRGMLSPGGGWSLRTEYLDPQITECKTELDRVEAGAQRHAKLTSLGWITRVDNDGNPQLVPARNEIGWVTPCGTRAILSLAAVTEAAKRAQLDGLKPADVYKALGKVAVEGTTPGAQVPRWAIQGPSAPRGVVIDLVRLSISPVSDPTDPTRYKPQTYKWKVQGAPGLGVEAAA